MTFMYIIFTVLRFMCYMAEQLGVYMHCLKRPSGLA